MQISINLSSFEEAEESEKGFFTKIKSWICQVSIWNCFVLLIVFVVLSLMLYICKAYTNGILLWLEKQDVTIIYTIIILLFTIVSFPISVGYILIVVATGYLFGLLEGLVLSVIGANVGLLVAHNVLKLFGQYSVAHSLIANELARTIFKVISGRACFKIVFCARLTPIPFGLQNAIFALSNINCKVYHIASLFGLLPGQLVGIYVGSSLRSMREVMDNTPISPFTYVFATTQLVFAAALLVWLGSKARRELAQAIAEAEGKSNLRENAMGYSII